MVAKGKHMHIDRANEVAMASKPADAARPGSASGLVTMPTYRTPATRSSFRAGEAHDVGSFGFVGEVVDIFAVFPTGHPLIVMASSSRVAHAMRVADEEHPYLSLNTKVDHLAGTLVAQVADTPLSPSTDLVPGSLQLLPTARMLRTTALLFSKLTQLFRSLPFKRADATSGHNQGCPRTGSHSSLVNFAQVSRCLHLARRLGSLFYLDAYVQFKARVPDQSAGPTTLRQGNGKHNGRPPSAHRQNNAPPFLVDGLGGPVNGVEADDSPGILHTHFGVCPSQCAGCLHIGEKSVHDHLYGLTVQGILSFGGSLQFVTPRPMYMSHSRILMGFHAEIPDLCRFQLSFFKSTEESRRQMPQLIHANGFHIILFSLSARKAVRGMRLLSSSRFPRRGTARSLVKLNIPVTERNALQMPGIRYT